MKKIDEKELHDLFTEFKNSNQSAYNKLYEKYYSLVYGIAFSIMKNKEDSEDISNEVFTKIYKIDKEKLPVSGESSWLFTVTRNECFSCIRKVKQNISIDEIYEVPSKSQEIEEIIDIDYYNKIISKLSEQEKTIVSLKILSNFTFSKISQIMNIPIGTVQWKYYKAINSLKISISGLAGATIAFMLVFLRREKLLKEKAYLSNKNSKGENIQKDNNNVNSNVDNIKESYQDASSSELKNTASEINENKNETVKEDNKEKENDINTVIEIQPKTSSNAEKIDAFSIAGIACGVVLITIFIIFFTKYQQKLHKKTSK